MTIEQFAALCRQLGPGQTLSHTSAQTQALFGAAELSPVMDALGAHLTERERRSLRINQIGGETIITRSKN